MDCSHPACRCDLGPAPAGEDKLFCGDRCELADQAVQTCPCGHASCGEGVGGSEVM